MLRRPFESGQYLSIRYTERLAEAGIEPSVGSTGDSYDNALAESVIGLYKTEEIHRRGPWKGVEDVEFATLEWVAWYNTSRLLGTRGLGEVSLGEAGVSVFCPRSQVHEVAHDTHWSPWDHVESRTC